MEKPRGKIQEDVWINTTCGVCYCGCGIRVRRVNGIPVQIEGIPGSTMSGENGGICGKGAAGIMYYHDPNRIKRPLRRTNPEKGIGVDPKWKEISWDEALNEIADRMKKIIADDPHKIMISVPTQRSSDGISWLGLWAAAFGSRTHGCYVAGGGSLHCGNAAHMLAGLVHASWSVAPDWKYTKYVLKFGSSKGTGSGHSMVANSRLRAQAINRGIKEVVFDPMCNFAGGKATEWIPILPGTDSAVALAMCNYILNELNVYDSLYLKAKTNLPFLIDTDAHYVRAKESGKPLVADIRKGKIVEFDDPDIGYEDYDLEGEYELDGVKCVPAFVLLKEHLKQYKLEWASEISTVPAETIKRIATEWAENAQIGSTITIEGKVYPYRPVAAVIFRGAQGHSNGIHQVAAIDLLNELVGAEDVPGGCLGWPSRRGKYPGGSYEMFSRKGPDGMIIPGIFFSHNPWPPAKPTVPCTDVGCSSFWVHATICHIPYVNERDEIWKKLGMSTMPEMVIGPAVNFLIDNSEWESAVEFFKDMFVIQFDLWVNETDEAVGDIILPDLSFLERENWASEIDTYFFSQSPSYEDWWCHMQKAVAKPIGEGRPYMDIFLDIAERAGFRGDFNELINVYLGIEDGELKVKAHEKLSWAEIGDRVLGWVYGADAEKIKKQGYATWRKPHEDVYWRWEMDTRVPVYAEFLLGTREEGEKIAGKVGLELNWEQYTPLPSWFFPETYADLNDEFDLIGFSYRDVLHTNNTTNENPLIDEVSALCPYTYTVTMHEDTARQKGFKEGDVLWLENSYGIKEKGALKLLQGQHPRTLAIAGQGGLWAKGRPIARGKGSNFCKLLPSYLRYYDPVTGTIETSLALKVYKAED